MKLTTKGRNAVTAMLDLCIHSQNQPVNLNSIHERQDVTVNYLEQIFIKLRRAGLVKSIRGPGGGYVLSRDPSSIKIAEIINAVEDNLKVTRCDGLVNCRDGAKCLGHDLWHSLEKVLDNFLHNYSLYDAAYPVSSSKNQEIQFLNYRQNNNVEHNNNIEHNGEY
ncbi:MAG: Rrf2 family transcriptional regulator [Neisseriaceae bacterium]|nr:MAG: Rrf2 family transcriptional regulator [Neisseriaceae bacterium]